MTATDRLTAALVRLGADGGRTPCSTPVDHLLWTSDDPAERMVALVACTPCPVLDLCGAAAEENAESFGVWGGRDLTTAVPRSKKKSSPNPKEEA